MHRQLILVPIAIVMISGGCRRGPQNENILISGNIELTQVDIAFKTSGKLIERAVNEGDKIAQGQLIARLDRDQLQRQREREQAALVTARAQLAQAQTAVEWQRQTLQADLEQRQADVNAAEAHLAELKNGSRPQEIQEAAATVAAAQAEYDRAAKDWERGQRLYKNDDISTSQFDQYRTRYESSEATLKQTKERAALVIAGPRKEVITGAEAQLARSRASVKAGEANALELKRRQEETTVRRSEIERSRAQIALIDSQLADTIASSPVSGVVLVKAADTGEILAAGATVVTVGDIEHPWLRGYIAERDLGRVKLGAKAKVTTDSYPGKVYWGRVAFISSDAEFTPKQIQTKEERVKLVYRVKILIDNPLQELKSNMPADAEILVEK